jgi:phosphate:Na+ symporter
MDYALISSIFFKVTGGLAIFLLGMSYMSGGIQAVAGSKLRKLISAVTNNRVMALGVGFSVTALIQSSSATSVMVVGFVNSGVMTLVQAIGVILGADIGTTVTGWILVLNIGEYGLPILGVFGIFYLFSKDESLRYLSMMLMGLGMIFFGLELMKAGFKPLREIEAFLNLFIIFKPDNFWGLIACALTGAFITALVQSSSASVGIVMGMASTGVLNFETSVALVMGMNLGTTVTAFLASLGASTNAKRAAYAHALIKAVGLVWVLPLFPFFLKVIPIIVGEDPGTIRIHDGVETFPFIISGIAVAHTLFNIINVIFHFPFIKQIASFLERVVPDESDAKQVKFTKFDIRMLGSPVIIIEQSRREIINMGNSILGMLNDLDSVIKNGFDDDKSIRAVFRKEEELDVMQKEITTFLVEIISRDLPYAQVLEAQAQLRMADEYESISDYIANNMKLLLKYFGYINNCVIQEKKPETTYIYAEGKSITHHFRELRTKHLQRLEKQKIEPLMSVTYMNILNSYRRIRDHAMNVAEVIIGEK